MVSWKTAEGRMKSPAEASLSSPVLEGYKVTNKPQEGLV
jgi:hypothetical protein